MIRLRHPRFLLFLGVLAGSLAAAAPLLPLRVAFLLGFDAGAMAFLAASAPLWVEAGTEAMRRRALRDDGGRVLLLVVSGVTLAAVLAAVFATIAADENVGARDLLLIVATLALAWLFVNTVFAFHYGHLYYDEAGGGLIGGGLNFPGTGAPVFSDFIYFSFIIGMTSQVSDVSIQSQAMRRAATAHGLLAFAFNLGVLAMTINVIAGALT